MNKRKAEQIHARRRFQERTGLFFTRNTNDVFCAIIHRHEAVFIKKTSNRTTVFDIPYQDNLYRCVYDKNRKQIVTVLGRIPIVKKETPSFIPHVQKPASSKKHSPYQYQKQQEDYLAWAKTSMGYMDPQESPVEDTPL